MSRMGEGPGRDHLGIRDRGIRRRHRRLDDLRAVGSQPAPGVAPRAWRTPPRARATGGVVTAADLSEEDRRRLAGGVERVVELSLSKREQKMFNQSVAAVRGLIDACKRLQKKQKKKAGGKPKRARAG